MSVHTHRVNNPEALARCAGGLGLAFDPSPEFRWDYSPHLRPGEADPTPPGEQVGVYRPDPYGPLCGFNRTPAVVGVFAQGDGTHVLAWDDFKDGWGLGSRIGPGGRHLKVAIALAECELAADRLGLGRKLSADADGRCRVALFRKTEDPDMQKQPEVVIDIDPTGKVKIEVNGAAGTSCENLTRGIEQALGSVESHELKPEYYKPVQQQQRVGQTTGG